MKMSSQRDTSEALEIILGTGEISIEVFNLGHSVAIGFSDIEQKPIGLIPNSTPQGKTKVIIVSNQYKSLDALVKAVTIARNMCDRTKIEDKRI